MTASERAARIDAFLARAGWEAAERRALPSDASFRRYLRLRRGDGARALLMDAPPGQEDVRPYVTVARALAAMGLSAPAILSVDEPGGFVLIEDFGDATFTRMLEAGAEPRPLYALAVDVLVHLHSAPGATQTPVPPYDEAALLQEAVLLPDWYLPALTGAPTAAAARERYLDAWRTVLRALPPVRESLVLRDYHVDNLMMLEGREGVAACGLLDFQDAVVGPCPYDLVSLLEDARRDVPAALARAMRTRYAERLPGVAGASFERWYTVLGVQRHCKVAGIFVRLCVRDGKPVYLPHIPRVMRLLARGLRHADLAPVAHWFAEHLPAPETPLPDFDPATVRRLVVA